MLSYQHAFHAGNHADILKHFVLSFVINSLNQKDKPYTFFDTHSGSGLYDLLDDRSIKTGEAKNGISKLILDNNCPEVFVKYKDLISSYYNKNLYPGSPEIERSLLRKGDFLILSELHPQEYENLKKNIGEQKSECSVMIHKRSGWEMINAMTPPSTKRGAVLIDPSYEETQDYTDAAKYITQINKKWSNGIIMLWYPLLSHREAEIESMLETIQNNARKVNKNVEISRLELCVFDKDSHKEVALKEALSEEGKKNPPRLYGSGMLVINSPWKLEESAHEVISYAESILRN